MSKTTKTRRPQKTRKTLEREISSLTYQCDVLLSTQQFAERRIARVLKDAAMEREQHATIIAHLSRELARHANAAARSHRLDAAQAGDS